MKKLILPVAIVLVGTGAAFATKVVKNNATIVDGYHIDAVSGQCVTDRQQCSNIPGPACTWSEDGVTQLLDAPITPTMCGDELFKP